MNICTYGMVSWSFCEENYRQSNEFSKQSVSFIYVYQSWIVGNQATDTLCVAQDNKIQKF